MMYYDPPMTHKRMIRAIHKPKIKSAICIKDGYMSTGRQFACKNKFYQYYFSSDMSLCYNVKTENQNHHNHSMSEEFFDEYFIVMGLPEETLLPEELFEL